MKSASQFVLMLCILCTGSLVADDKLPQTERKNTGPTMAKFYKVDGSGRSRSDQVTVPTLSNPEEKANPEQKASPEQQDESASRPKAAPRKAGGSRSRQKDSSKTVSITINRDSRRYDPQDEWRCERAGFYYTRDGRCVAPAPALRVPAGR